MEKKRRAAASFAQFLIPGAFPTRLRTSRVRLAHLGYSITNLLPIASGLIASKVAALRNERASTSGLESEAT
jgi:hypothetical protein